MEEELVKAILRELAEARKSMSINRDGWSSVAASVADRQYWEGQIDAFTWVLEKAGYKIAPTRNAES